METLDTPVQTLPQYDLFVLGLAWLRTHKPEELGRVGASVFHAMRHAGVLNEQERRAIATDQALINFVMPHIEFLRCNRSPGKKKLGVAIDTSDKHVVTLVIPGGMLRYPKLFGKEGYKHVITAKGMAYAEEIAGTYEDRIDPERFMLGWRSFTRQMSNMYTTRREVQEER